MKAFFILLLLTNITFALVQWLLPYEQVKKQAPPRVAAETLRLLDDLEPQQLLEKSEPQPVEKINQEQLVENVTVDAPLSIPDKLCYTLGPFKDKQVSQEVALKFKQNKISISSRSSQEKEYQGMMVYIGGHKSRSDAIATAESLAAKGERDYIIVSDPGKYNMLSLGVFGLKKNADRRLKEIAKLGYAVKSEPRYLNRTIYWLDYSESENENLTRFIDQFKMEKGISRISRQCSE